jgi:uncharacterized protein YrrD
MVKYLIQKKGFLQSAAMFPTLKEAQLRAKEILPYVPYRIRKISENEAIKRQKWATARLKKKGLI